MSWQVLIAVGSGGFIGAVSRVYIVSIINSMHSYSIPVGTIIVNVLGSFLLGLLFAYFQHYSTPAILKSFLAIGLLGAFTTFSTFAIESVFLLSSFKLFIIYISATTFGSIFVAFLSYKGLLMLLNKITTI